MSYIFSRATTGILYPPPHPQTAERQVRGSLNSLPNPEGPTTLTEGAFAGMGLGAFVAVPCIFIGGIHFFLCVNESVPESKLQPGPLPPRHDRNT